VKGRRRRSELDRTGRLLRSAATMSTLREEVDAFFGRRRHSILVPVMDGALQPNGDLNEAEALSLAPALDNLTACGDELLFSSGARPQRFSQDAPSEISCLAASAGGALAIGLGGAGLVVPGGPHNVGSCGNCRRGRLSVRRRRCSSTTTRSSSLPDRRASRRRIGRTI